MGYSYTVQYSPNQSSRGSYGYGPTPTGITIHWWGAYGQQHANVVNWLTRPRGNTSAHEVISDGRVTHLVDFDRAAWHSGSTEGNGSTIGLECRPEMTAGDLETLAQRCADIENHLGRSMYYYGHSDWYATACPGTYYDRIGWLVKRVNEIHAGIPEEDDMSAEAERRISEMHRWLEGYMVNSVKRPWDGEEIWASTTLQYLINYVVETVRDTRVMRPQIAGLTAAVAALSDDSTLTAERVEQIVRDAVKQNIEITGNVEIGGVES